MPVCAATRRSHFNAAHRLHNPARSDDWNAATFGPCNNPNFHGHNYELDVTVEGAIDQETGYVLDLGHLADVVNERIIRRLDHRNLNVEVDWFAELNPTVENIAVAIWRELRAALPESLTLRVRLWETPRNYVEYQGG